jgi:hypothetical protein
MEEALFPEYITEFSPCRTWRYVHEVQWDDGPCVAFVMFNPSTADESQLDPTLRKCRGFAQRWGYGRMVILNLFAVRGTDPRTPSQVSDPVGPMNDYWILKTVAQAREIVFAYGCGQWIKTPEMKRRPSEFLKLIRAHNEYMLISCLGYRNDGHPRHPLMLSYTTERVGFVPTVQ